MGANPRHVRSRDGKCYKPKVKMLTGLTLPVICTGREGFKGRIRGKHGAGALSKRESKKNATQKPKKKNSRWKKSCSFGAKG